MILKRNAVGVGKTMCIELRKMTGTNMRALEIDYTTSFLHANRKASTANFVREKTAECRRVLGISFISN
jgi:hypothetical protein